MRRWLLVTTDLTVAHAVTDAPAKRDIVIRRHSRRCRVPREPRIRSHRSERPGGNDGGLDEFRSRLPHDDIERAWVELGNDLSRSTVLVHVSSDRDVSVPLFVSSRDDGIGRRDRGGDPLEDD
jgi:hypothetical protein